MVSSQLSVVSHQGMRVNRSTELWTAVVPRQDDNGTSPNEVLNKKHFGSNEREGKRSGLDSIGDETLWNIDWCRS